MTEQHSDQHLDLVARAQKGDREAFDGLVTAYQDRLRLYISSRVKLYIGPRIDIDEVRQETFVKAYESIGRFEWQGEDSLFQWLCGIAKHVLMKAAERFRKSEQIEKAQGVLDSGTSPSRLLRRDERLERLQRALDALPPEYRTVIQLARVEGLRIKEIAERLGRSPDSVKHLLSRAVARLRAGFGDTESYHLPDRGLQFEENADGEQRPPR